MRAHSKVTLLVRCCTAILQCLLSKHAQSELNVWFTDDGTIGRNIDKLLIDFDVIVNESKNIGLIISTSKCELITDDEEIVQQFRTVAPDITHVQTSAAMLLGAPVGDEHSMDEVLTAKLHELRRMSDRFSQFKAHDAFFS
jgi:hypothetical protein